MKSQMYPGTQIHRHKAQTRHELCHSIRDLLLVIDQFNCYLSVSDRPKQSVLSCDTLQAAPHEISTTQQGLL